MKLKGYIFYKNGEKIAIPEDRPNSYYNALWGVLQSKRNRLLIMFKDILY